MVNLELWISDCQFKDVSLTEISTRCIPNFIFWKILHFWIYFLNFLRILTKVTRYLPRPACWMQTTESMPLYMEVWPYSWAHIWKIWGALNGCAFKIINGTVCMSLNPCKEITKQKEGPNECSYNDGWLWHSLFSTDVAEFILFTYFTLHLFYTFCIIITF